MSSEKYGPPTTYGTFSGPITVRTSSGGTSSTKTYGQKLSVTRPAGDGSVTVNIKGGVVYRDAQGKVSKRTQISPDQAKGIIQSEGREIEQDVQTVRELSQQPQREIPPQLRKPTPETQAMATQTFWQRAGQQAGQTWENVKRKAVPGYADESDFAQARAGYLQRQEQRRLQGQAQQFADIRGKQIQYGLEEKRDVAQSNINQLAQDLQSQINKGVLSVSTAKEILNKRIDAEKQGLQVEYSQAGERLEQDFGEFEKGYLQEQRIQAEGRIQSQLSKETFGLGVTEHGISLDLFALKKSKPLRSAYQEMNRAYDQAEKLMKSQSFQKLSQQPQKDFTLGLMTNTMAAGEKYILPRAQEFVGIGAGMVRRPVTTGAIALAALGLGAGAAYAYPGVALSAAKGSSAASLALSTSKGVSIGLGTLFVGSSALRIATAPSKKEALMRGGETISFATAGLLGGAAGSKIGSKLFEFGLSKYPTKITSTVKQKEISPNQFQIKTKGVAVRGKKGEYRFPFETKESISLKDTGFVRKTQMDSWFLSHKQPSVETTMVGREIPSVAGVPSGPQSYITGTMKQGVFGIPKKVSYTVYPGGEVKGQIGKTFFSSTITKPAKVGDLLFFNMKEVVAPRGKMDITKIFSSKKGQLAIPGPSTQVKPTIEELIGVRGFGVGRTSSQLTGGTPRITRTLPGVMPEAVFIAPIAPLPKTLIPFIGGARGQSKLKDVTFARTSYTAKPFTMPGLLTVNIPQYDIQPKTDTLPSIRTSTVTQPSAPSIFPTFNYSFKFPTSGGGGIDGGWIPSFRKRRIVRSRPGYYTSTLWGQVISKRLPIKVGRRLARTGVSGLEIRPRLKRPRGEDPFSYMKRGKKRKGKRLKRQPIRFLI